MAGAAVLMLSDWVLWLRLFLVCGRNSSLHVMFVILVGQAVEYSRKYVHSFLAILFPVKVGVLA